MTRYGEEHCYHCGLPIPSETDFWVTIEGKPRRMCCAGCEAVASAIVKAGLSDYYRHRDAMPEPVREPLPAILAELEAFDEPEIVAKLSHEVEGEGEKRLREVFLILEGITCAACVWLNERHLRQQPGVVAVQINYATHRAYVRWDPQQITLSRLLQAVAEIGYRAYPYDPQATEAVAARERRQMLWRVFVAGLSSMQVMMYLVPTYLAGEGEMLAEHRLLFYWASFVLTLPVMIYSCGPFFQHAWRDLRARRIGIDVPVALGLLIAFIASVLGMVTGLSDVYFDSVSMFAFFLLAGRYFEMSARQRAVRGLENLARAVPAVAERWDESAKAFVPVPAMRLMPGDRIRVKPGVAFPADGVIIAGATEVDEALLTGESIPVLRRAGEPVLAGSHNVSGVVEVRVERVGEESRLATIRRLVERAQHERPPVAALADQLAGRFVATVLALALFTALFWAWRDPAMIIPTVVAVLIVACPCALALATPAAITASSDALLRAGILLVQARVLEKVPLVTDLILDKTGTLTEGRPRLVGLELLRKGARREWALALAAALEESSNHPIAEALRSAFAEVSNGQEPLRVFAVEHEVGGGLWGWFDGKRVAIGRRSWVLNRLGLADEHFGEESLSWARASEVLLADDEGLIARFWLEDLPRSGLAEVLQQLRAWGVRLHLFSGDRPEAVAAFAASFGFEKAEGGLMPEEKYERLQQLRQQGRVLGVVGDGVNDAAVLAAADFGVAMGAGADLARSRADVVLLRNDLTGLLLLMMQARRTLAVIRQNLTWSFGYNVAAIPLAMAGWVTPWLAGIGMAASSLLVVMNALRLGRLPQWNSKSSTSSSLYRS